MLALHKKDQKIAERFKSLVSKRVKVYEIKVFDSRVKGVIYPGRRHTDFVAENK